MLHILLYHQRISFNFKKYLIFLKISSHYLCRRTNNGHLLKTPKFMCRNCWELRRDSVWNLPKFIQKESRILYTLFPIHLQNNTLSPCSSSSTMSACWDLLLNECCFKTFSSIFPSPVHHCWPTYVHCSKSISVMCSSSASGEVSSHQHWRWVSYSALRSSC